MTLFVIVLVFLVICQFVRIVTPTFDNKTMHVPSVGILPTTISTWYVLFSQRYDQTLLITSSLWWLSTSYDDTNTSNDTNAVIKVVEPENDS